MLFAVSHYKSFGFCYVFNSPVIWYCFVYLFFFFFLKLHFTAATACVTLFTVDCWDGPEEEPVVYHGHTLTSKITFKSAIDCINEFAFEASELVHFIFHYAILMEAGSFVL